MYIYKLEVLLISALWDPATIFEGDSRIEIYTMDTSTWIYAIYIYVQEDAKRSGGLTW